MIRFFKFNKVSFVTFCKKNSIDVSFFINIISLPIIGNLVSLLWIEENTNLLHYFELEKINQTVVVWLLILLLSIIYYLRKRKYKIGITLITSLILYFVSGIIFPSNYTFKLKPKFIVFESHLPKQTEENYDEYFDNVHFDDYDFPEANMVFSLKEEDCVEIEKQLKLDGKIFHLKRILFWQTGYLYGAKYQKFEDENEFDIVSIFFLFGPVIIVEIIINSVLKYSIGLFLLSVVLIIFKKSHLLKLYLT
ncbi:hypothetical protein MCERE19_03054 [Spirosomataceae bacterium]|jgi:hypothetical protein